MPTVTSAAARCRWCCFSTSAATSTTGSCVIDGLASRRRVIAFDNVGVGGTNGTTPSTVEQMAADAISFLDAMEFDRVDILSFSIGSFVAQEIALTRPTLVRSLVLASSLPKAPPECTAGLRG